MMTNQSYEQRIGLLTNTTYGAQPIPTLLGNDGSAAGNYTNDHPVGVNATISTKQPGLVWSGTAFSVTSGSQYAQFVANYGWPALAPGKYSNPYGVNTAGQPYVVCTTCHNQHVMTVYTSSAASQIQNDGGGKYYATYFFVNGPYNPNLQTYCQQLGAIDDGVLPSVPLWRVERRQQHQQHQSAIPVRTTCTHGEREFLSPFFDLRI